MKYDIALVLGIGIREDGSLPDSAKALVRKAVELVHEEIASKVIFSGRWAYTLKYIPPNTEAEAMASYAKSIGLTQDKILIENESITTISNLCLLKEKYLAPENLTNVILVTLKPLAERALFNARMVFGPTYKLEVAYADFSYPPDKEQQLMTQEQVKLAQAKQFHNNNQPGDHQAIYIAATKDLEENYLRKNSARKF